MIQSGNTGLGPHGVQPAQETVAEQELSRLRKSWDALFDVNRKKRSRADMEEEDEETAFERRLAPGLA
jgi:hypothetical protein